MSFLKIDSYKKGAITSIFFSGVAKGLAFFQSVIIAFYFGTSFHTDVYFFVYTTITLIASYIISLNYLVLIPEAMKLSATVSDKEAQRFLNLFLYIFVFLVLLLEIIFFCNPIHFFGTFSKLDISILNSEKGTMIWFMPVLLLIVLSAYFTDILTSKKYFALPLIVNSVNSLLTVISVFLLHQYFGVRCAIIGIYVGYFFNLVWLVYILLSRLKWDFWSVSFKLRRGVLRNILYAYLSQVTTFLGSFFPIYLISSFSAGIMTSLSYAQRVGQIPEQLIISQTSSVLGIKLNELNVTKQTNQLNRVLIEVAASTLFLIVPCSFLLFLYSDKIVEIIFMRGSFGMSSVHSTALLLKFLGVSIPFVALNAFYSRVFIALQKMKLAFYSGLIVNILFLLLLYVLVKFFGPIGYPIAITTYLAASVLVVFPLLFYFKMPIINSAALLRCVLQIYLLNLLISFPVWLLIVNHYQPNIGFYILWVIACLIIVNYYTKTSMHFYLFQKTILSKLLFFR
ncbi:MAG TPA: lipid II flippase MurJ [Flavisolibacter sp.]